MNIMQILLEGKRNKMLEFGTQTETLNSLMLIGQNVPQTVNQNQKQHACSSTVFIFLI